MMTDWNNYRDQNGKTWDDKRNPPSKRIKNKRIWRKQRKRRTCDGGLRYAYPPYHKEGARRVGDAGVRYGDEG